MMVIGMYCVLSMCSVKVGGRLELARVVAGKSAGEKYWIPSK